LLLCCGPSPNNRSPNNRSPNNRSPNNRSPNTNRQTLVQLTNYQPADKVFANRQTLIQFSNGLGKELGRLFDVELHVL
jgi:hypothetical protein